VDRTSQSVGILEDRYLFDNFIMVARIFTLIVFHSNINNVHFGRW
jgi:hypothetical protein